MSAPTILRAKPEIEYPDSDGRPIADNTLQFQYEKHARAQQERERAERLAARLRELGVEPDE